MITLGEILANAIANRKQKYIASLGSPDKMGNDDSSNVVFMFCADYASNVERDIREGKEPESKKLPTSRPFTYYSEDAGILLLDTRYRNHFLDLEDWGKTHGLSVKIESHVNVEQSEFWYELRTRPL